MSSTALTCLLKTWASLKAGNLTLSPRRKEREMRKSRFSEEQKVRILREADESPVAEVAKKHGISQEMLYNVASDVRRDGCRRREATDGARGR